ncbi:hypothetical protein B005_4402 [Nocardiopsis alba ATCC BAA-2165]|uniref:Uncharacterized protein n=1 Tax=Nocardiopsis alba (strain ATCC BAA-2165 / BE74) TaxID=1205910 RepID=J7L939_NOCAA|nr:hypothetical protein B005_4402 [Nocardiopsis alba ATCC BAA-2165]
MHPNSPSLDQLQQMPCLVLLNLGVERSEAEHWEHRCDPK